MLFLLLLSIMLLRRPGSLLGQGDSRLLGDAATMPQPVRNLPQIIADGRHGVDVHINLVQNAYLKPFCLVHSAKSAVVPRTIARETYPQLRTAALAGWTVDTRLRVLMGHGLGLHQKASLLGFLV